MGESTKKIAVVTGAYGNIGVPICAGLARTGATVVMVGRGGERARQALATVAEKSGGAGAIETLDRDLGSLASIRAAAAELSARHPRLDVLINNAAAFSRERTTTKDGFERTLGVAHLGHFLLTNLLEAPLSAARGRVVVVAMPSKTPIRFDDLMLERAYDGMTAYGMAKAANLHFTLELAERWKGGVMANALHPGMTRTTLISEAPLPIRVVFALFARSQERSAETPVWLATAPEVGNETGGFYINKKRAPFPKGADAPDVRRRLWDESARLVGLGAMQAAA
jgi:NAD(P)-dependent dehydrogenase (short-subunit alcohol dehydrogenase family)